MLIAYVAAWAILQIRGDGFFPFPKTWPLSVLIAIAVAHTVVLVAAVGTATWYLVRGPEKGSARFPEVSDLGEKLIAVGCVLGIAVFHRMQVSRFAEFGYALHPEYLIPAVALALASVVTLPGKGRAGNGRWWLGLLVAFVVLKIYPILAFPITAKRSDLLPILSQAGASWLRGESPYQYFTLDNGVATQNVRLPGLIWAYLPAVRFGFDLRWISLFFELATLLVWGAVLGAKLKTAAESRSWRIAVILFLLMPYWHYRHELYEPPFWFVLSLCFAAWQSRRFVALGLALGLLAATHQWGWIFAPYFVVSEFRRNGFSKAGLIRTGATGVLAAASGALLLVIGIRGQFGSFKEHVFGFYERYMAGGDLYPMSLYFSAAFMKLGLAGLLRPLQFLLQLSCLGLVFLYGTDGARLAGIFALGLTLQIVLNPVAWTYQYLLVLLLMLYGWGLKISAPSGPTRAL